MASNSLLEISGLSKDFKRRGREPVKALDNVSLAVDERRVVGLVGESGSGKTTLIRCLMGLEAPDTGSICYDGIDVLRPGEGSVGASSGRCN